MPRPLLPFRRVRSSCSRIRSARANRVEILEARRLLSAAVESIQAIDPQFFLDPISAPIQVDLAAPIIPIFATPTPISEVVAIPAPDAEVVEVTTPGEVFQPVVIGPFPTLPPIAADTIDQTDDQKVKDKSDKKEKKEKKDKSDRKEKNNRGGDALAQVEDPIDNVITIDPVDGSFGGGGDDPLGLPPVSGGTDLGIGDGSTPQWPVIQIPDTNVPVIEVPIVAIPITELPVVDVPPTVIPPIDVPPVATPPVDVPPTDETPTDDPPVVAPPTDESPTVTPPPTDTPPTDTPPPSEPIVELPTDDGTDPVTERPTDERLNPSKPVVDGGDDNVVRNPVTENPVEREPGIRQPDSSINPGNDVVSKPQENGDSLTPAPAQSARTEDSVAQGDSSADNVDQRSDTKSAADDFADKAAAAAVFSSAPVTLDDDVAAPAEGDQAAGEATVDAIEAVPVEEAHAAGEAAQSDDEHEETKYGRVGAGGASEESRRVVRRFSVHVQTLAELAVADPEQAQLAAGTLPVQSVAEVTAEGEQVEEQAYPAAMASFSPASPTTTANVHNIMAAVLAGATFVTIYWNRWRKRKLEEAAAAASKLAGLLRFDPLAVWLDDNRPRHRR